MKLILKNIILYPKDRTKPIRSVEFVEGKVNVIRGFSHRGKSAIIHIIDYCLGSSDCNIPVKLIRDKVDKFAIFIKTENSDIFLARNNPDEQNSTTSMFMFELHKINIKSFISNKDIYNRFEKIKTSREDVITRLNQIVGLSNETLGDNESNSQWNSAASFRDLSAFKFQPQPIIANPTTLFYKTDTYRHQNKLRIILPLILGFKTYEMLALEKEIKDLSKDIEEKQLKLEKEKQAFELWKQDLYLFYTEAIKVGLANADLDKNNSNVNQIIIELRKIVDSVKSGQLFIKGSSTQYIDAIEKLNDRRNFLSSQLDDHRLNLLKIQAIDQSKNDYYNNVIKTKVERLSPVEWFLREVSEEKCPFCDSYSSKAIGQLEMLKEEQIKNQNIEKVVLSSEINLDKQINFLKKQIGNIESELEDISIYFNKLTTEKEDGFSIEDVYKFAGRIEQAIVNANNTAPDGVLQSLIDSLNIQVNEKRSSLEALESSLSYDAVIKSISGFISNYTSILDIEDGNKNRVILDVESLTIRIKDEKREKPYYLSRIGSGANHMGYHLATMFGLHEYFLSLPARNRKNFVPNFLILDQPSQVYFPQKIHEKSKEIFAEEGDEDFQNTKKIFSACSEFIKNTAGKVQLIILEHVPESVWSDFDNIHLVEEWTSNDKENNALIPKSWIN